MGTCSNMVSHREGSGGGNYESQILAGGKDGIGLGIGTLDIVLNH